MSDTRDFQQFLENFLKMPVTPEQNAAIIGLMLDGTINRQGAKELLRTVIDQNIMKYKEFISMSKEEMIAAYPHLTEVL
jgi:Asp-tRNA(Asn)/Glu-tRNA(Gln) amidotransferase B subunit